MYLLGLLATWVCGDGDHPDAFDWDRVRNRDRHRLVPVPWKHEEDMAEVSATSSWRHFESKIYFDQDKFIYVNVAIDNAFGVPRFVCIAIAGIHLDCATAMSKLRSLSNDLSGE